jgi:hypothetical protein
LGKKDPAAANQHDHFTALAGWFGAVVDRPVCPLKRAVFFAILSIPMYVIGKAVSFRGGGQPKPHRPFNKTAQ